MKNNYIIEGNITRIILNRRHGKDMETIIDTEDFDKINAFEGSFYAALTRTDGKYYAKITVKSSDNEHKRKYYIVRMHRIILGYEEQLPHIDHINDDSLDNRKENLRIATNANNLKNRSHCNSNNVSGYRNVSKVEDKYFVQLQINGKNKVLGKFTDAEEANRFSISMRQINYG